MFISSFTYKLGYTRPMQMVTGLLLAGTTALVIIKLVEHLKCWSSIKISLQQQVVTQVHTKHVHLIKNTLKCLIVGGGGIISRGGCAARKIQ